MRNNVKKIGIFTAALLCAGCLSAGVVSANTLTANAESEVVMTEMTYGAALRLGDNFGLRFQTTVNQEWFDAQENAKVRMLLIQESRLTGELTKDTVGVYGVGEGQELTNRSTKDDVYQYNAVIVDIPDYAYDQPIVARGCVELSDGSYVYTDAATIQTRSVAQVANSALEDKFDDYYEDLGKYLVKDISIDSVGILGLNATGTFTADVEYFANATQDIQNKLNEKTAFTFESSDSSLISVDAETGEYSVNGNSYGEVTITATAWGKITERKVLIGSSAEYKTNYTVDIPANQYYRLGRNSFDNGSGASYSNGATVPEGNRNWSAWYADQTSLNLGNGLLVTSAGNLNSNDGSYHSEWTYPQAVDLTGKTSADTLLDIMMIPQTALAEQSLSVSVYLRDTEDSSNYVLIRMQPHNWGDYMTVTFNGADCSMSYNQDGGIGTNYGVGDLNGSSNIMLSFDYAEKAIYAFKHCPSDWLFDKMFKIADLDDTNLFPNGQWGGFANGTAYISVAFEYISTENHSVQFFVRDILGADLDVEYKTNYTVDIPEGQTYRLGTNSFDVNSGTNYENQLNLGNGLLVTSLGDYNLNSGAYNSRWTYSQAVNLTGKTSADTLLDIMPITQTAGQRDGAIFNIYLTDTEDSSNYIHIKVAQGNWGAYMTVTFSGAADAPVSLGTNGINGSYMWGLGEWNGTQNILLSFDYEEKAIYAFLHTPSDYRFDKMFKVADLDDTTLFPNGQWGGFTKGTAYISVAFENISTENHSVQFFVRNILGCDFAPIAKEENN